MQFAWYFRYTGPDGKFGATSPKLMDPAAGSEAAWGDLVDGLAGLVWSVARSLGLYGSDAADVSQTVWLKFVENIAKLRVEYREKSKRDMLIGMILEDKILDYLESKSKITEGEVAAPAEKAVSRRS